MKKAPPKPEGWRQVPNLDQRPAIVALAGPNGAGKSTFYEAHLKACGLRFLNADILAGELGMDAYRGAEVTAKLRAELIAQRESFIFETVFSDPVGDKLEALKQAAAAGYQVVMCFVGLGGAARSEERVAMRVSQGGHDVPADKLAARFPRTLANLRRAIRELPCVYIFDNDDLRTPFRLVAIFESGHQTFLARTIPEWLKATI